MLVPIVMFNYVEVLVLSQVHFALFMFIFISFYAFYLMVAVLSCLGFPLRFCVCCWFGFGFVYVCASYCCAVLLIPFNISIPLPLMISSSATVDGSL